MNYVMVERSVIFKNTKLDNYLIFLLNIFNITYIFIKNNNNQNNNINNNNINNNIDITKAVQLSDNSKS